MWSRSTYQIPTNRRVRYRLKQLEISSVVRNRRWIKGTKPDQPINEVAYRALKNRLALVWRFLRLAAKEPHKNIEYVHQLRVATRRAVAAFQIFSELTPDRRAAKICKDLKKVRSIAGIARDRDVLIDRLSRDERIQESKDLAQVVHKIRRQRQKAQKPLIRVHKQLKDKGFKSSSRRLVKKIRRSQKGRETSFRVAARSSLNQVVDQFFRSADDDLLDIVALHKMRIAGKRLRYAMELLAGAFEKSFRTKLYPVFVEVQDRLGEINDHATACSLFNKWAGRLKEGRRAEQVRELSKKEEDLIESACVEFRQWWTQTRCDELKQRFRQYSTEAKSSQFAHRDEPSRV